MKSGKIDTTALLCDRFKISEQKAKAVEAILDGIVRPTTFSVVRESADKLSAVEQVLMAISYLIGGASVQQIKHGTDVIAYWTGRGGEGDWALLRNVRGECWEIACPKTFTEQYVARQS